MSERCSFFVSEKPVIWSQTEDGAIEKAKNIARKKKNKPVFVYSLIGDSFNVSEITLYRSTESENGEVVKKD